MLMRIWTGFLLSGLCASLVALVVVYMHEKGVYPFRDAWSRLGRQPWGRRIAIAAFVVGMWVYASVKPGDGLRGANTTRTLTGEDFRRGFVMTQIETGEEHDFSAPPDATIVSDWQAFGAATDWIYESVKWKVESGKWKMGSTEVETSNETKLRIHSDGWVEVKDGPVFYPLKTILGIVPEANWGQTFNFQLSTLRRGTASRTGTRLSSHGRMCFSTGMPEAPSRSR